MKEIRIAKIELEQEIKFVPFPKNYLQLVGWYSCGLFLYAVA
jgi:hypothetical protein